MRFTIETEKDLRQLQGKFILQVTVGKEDTVLNEDTWEFSKAKRLYLVAGYSIVSLYGEISKPKTFEEFKNMFNRYLFNHSIKEGETDGGRFHRLLTSKEIDFLCKKLKEENY